MAGVSGCHARSSRSARRISSLTPNATNEFTIHYQSISFGEMFVYGQFTLFIECHHYNFLMSFHN